MNKWTELTKRLGYLEEEFAAKRTLPIVSVHKMLLDRAVSIVGNVLPEAEKYYRRRMRTMLRYAAEPDKKGDRENGMGKHYYCSAGIFGQPLSPVCGYYRNGVGNFSMSARTMFEEDYTMAVTMAKAGYPGPSAVYLGRAVHMISDMCCLPHGTGMTYFSPLRGVHKAYESLAEVLYPEFVPKQKLDRRAMELFRDREGFAEQLNAISVSLRRELPFLLSSPLREIVYRLHFTERAVASLLIRFYEDLSLTPEEVHCITDGMRFVIYPDIPPLTANIWEKGIYFTLNEEGVFIPIGKYETGGVFRAAHRGNSRFTFSPVTEREGRVIESGQLEVVDFSPLRKNQFFRPL